MIRKLIAAAALTSLPFVSHANWFNLDHSVSCADNTTVATLLVQRYNEKVVWNSSATDNRGDTITFTFAANQETGTWSLVRDIEGGRACIIAHGQGFSR